MGNSAGMNVGRCAAAVLIAVFASHCRADEGAPERVVLEMDANEITERTKRKWWLRRLWKSAG